MSETSRFAFPVPLTSQVRAIAQHKIELSLDENARRLKILPKLAFHAVSYYLRCMAFEVDQQYGDGQEGILFHLLEGTDIYVRGIGRLECCPVDKTDTTYNVPIDAWEERLAYIFVEIDEHYQEAQIIGFFPAPLSESKTLLLNQLYPVSDLPQYLYHSIVTLSPSTLLQSQNLMGDVTDRQLLELVLEAQGHPPHSPERQRSLTRLVIEIKRSGRLDRLRRLAASYPPSLFQDLYNEALQETYMYICQKVDLYRPDHPVMAWVNNTLHLVIEIKRSGQLDRLRRLAASYPPSLFQDLYNEALQETYMYICQKVDLYRPDHPTIAWFNDTLYYKFLDVVKKHYFHEMPYEPLLFDQLFSTTRNDEQPRLDYDTLRDFLEADPEGLLRSYSIRYRPTVTFRFLAIARHIDEKTWEDLSRETGISLKTLASFFTRTLQKLLPYFQKYL